MRGTSERRRRTATSGRARRTPPFNPTDGVTYTRPTPEPNRGIRIARASGFWIGQAIYAYGGPAQYAYAAAVKM